MKNFTLTLAIMVAAMAASCQKEEPADINEPQEADAAYISLSVVSPTSRAADGTTEKGTDEENKIFSLALIAFDNNYDYIGATPSYVSDDGLFHCEVAADARRFFAVVNPTEEIWKAINAVSSYDQSAFSNLPAIALTAASVSTENMKGGSESGETRGFTMVNSGVKNSEGILLESLVSITTELSEDPDHPTPVTIPVDRLVTKFEYGVSSSFDDNTESKFGEGEDLAVGEVLGVALTATNKATNLYSMILTNELTNDNVYRTDHNMTVGQSLSEAADIRAQLMLNFNWLQNADETTDDLFITPAMAATTPEYALENTCEGSYSNSNNLTQAVVKALYNPKMSSGDVLDLGTGWFKMYTTTGDGTLYLTFDEVKKMYDGQEVYGFTATAETKASMDIQLQKIMGNSTSRWSDAGVTYAVLEDCPYGGYKAAIVDDKEDCVLQYYQGAVNYYDIFIQHDEAQPKVHTGRWGMVRNNSYTMDITGIRQEGLPYIPDPTNDKIVDPDNKKPEDPEPADKINTYISVNISVNPWVIWSQESELM